MPAFSSLSLRHLFFVCYSLFCLLDSLNPFIHSFNLYITSSMALNLFFFFWNYFLYQTSFHLNFPFFESQKNLPHTYPFLAFSSTLSLSPSPHPDFRKNMIILYKHTLQDDDTFGYTSLLITKNFNLLVFILSYFQFMFSATYNNL